MKKNILVSLLVLFSLSFLWETTIVHADEKTNEIPNKTIIYDKDGKEVKPTNQYKEILRGVSPPTTVKWLNNSASYQSDGFSGSGRRYSGYSFGTMNSSETFKLTFRIGGFGVNTFSNPNDPGHVIESYNLPLSGSPYTFYTPYYFYFLVDNPRSGQTYHLRAIQ